MGIIVTNEETKDWLMEEPKANEYLLEAYKAAISDMTDDILLDPRSSQNTHLINENFSSDPQYMMAFQAQTEKKLFIISCLYVFPHMRCKGMARFLINQAKLWVRDQGVIQVAVEENQLDRLSSFYSSLGFQTTCHIHFNLLGKGYVDYFWSGKKIRLKNGVAGTIVSPVER